MDSVAKIRQLFPAATYFPPCSEQEITEAAELLGNELPGELRDVYLSFNGFDVPTSPPKLFPLLPRHAETSLVKCTLLWRAGPDAVQDIIFYGMSEKQYYLGIRLSDPHAIVEHNYDLDEPQTFASTIGEGYAKDQAWAKNLNLEKLGGGSPSF